MSNYIRLYPTISVYIRLYLVYPTISHHIPLYKKREIPEIPFRGGYSAMPFTATVCLLISLNFALIKPPMRNSQLAITVIKKYVLNIM